MVNAAQPDSLTPSSFSANDVNQIALCFETLSEQFLTLGQIFRGTLARPAQINGAPQLAQLFATSAPIAAPVSTQLVSVPPAVTAVVESSKPGKRKKREKDPNAPTRAPSAYLLYCKDARQEMSPLESDSNKGAAMMAALGKGWKELSEADKAKYTREAEAEAAKYQEKLAAYKTAIADGTLPPPQESAAEASDNTPKKRKRTPKKVPATVVEETTAVPEVVEPIPAPTPAVNPPEKAATPPAANPPSKKASKFEKPKTRSSPKKNNAATQPAAQKETPDVPSPAGEQDGKKKKNNYKKNKKRNKANGAAQ